MVGSNRLPLLALLLCLAAVGCGKKKATDSSAGAGKSYTVRAKIEAVDGRELTLRHEAIPDFVNAFGETSGMKSMAMPFAAAKDLPLDGIAAGDLVEVVIHTDWNASTALIIDKITKLPPDTALKI
jgi:hypothetical protein